MSGTQAQVLIDSASSVSAADACVIPILAGAVTGSGAAIASQITLADLATFFEATDAPVHITSANAFAFSVGLAGATNPAFNVDSSTASQAAGLNVIGATAAGTVAVGVISSGANASLSVAAKGTGTITFGSTLLASGIAQKASVGTTPGTAGTDFAFTAGQGGNTTIATTGVGGKGAGWTTTTGAGGTAALAATAGTGGAGGDYAVTTGAGAASAVTGAGTGTGGKGGALAFLSGVGGAASTSTGANVGGASGAITLTTAAGGAATDGSANTGGASGVITLATGNGGAGATAAGNSGAITLQTGTTTATVGSIVLKPGGTAALTANSALDVVFGNNLLVGGSVGATAASTVALSNAAVDPTTSADLVHLYAKDISAGHCSLAIYSEETVNAAVAVASTHRLPITINGTQYAVLLTTVLS